MQSNIDKKLIVGFFCVSEQKNENLIQLLALLGYLLSVKLRQTGFWGLQMMQKAILLTLSSTP
ncbi:MAG: hypothetical protein IGS03_08680 [Candidatus Sericytochromatia bacterium]|nr:hypothetical protein [Candidatus Sericytochromatia bacterium]